MPWRTRTELSYRPVLLAWLFVATTVNAELVLSIYGGKALTDDTDLRLRQPGGTDLTFHDVSWVDRSFEMPLYYGARLTYWLDHSPRWGASLDFAHAKIYLDERDTVHVTGTRAGLPVN